MNICIVNCFDTWEERVDLLFNVMEEGGHNVKVLCSDFRHIEKNKRKDNKKNYKFFTAKPYKKNISIARLYSHVQLSKDIFKFVEEHSDKIDLLWVLSPPNCFVRDAAGVKKRYPALLLAIDIIDLWPETMPVGGIKKLPVINIWKEMRNMGLRCADMIITECNLYKTILEKEIEGNKTETLYLAHEKKEYRPNLNLPEGKIGLCYLGSINNIIDIDCIVDIVKQCKKRLPVIFHIIGNGEKKKKLIENVQKAGAEVVYHGKVYDYAEKQKIFDACHYGLNIMKRTVCVGLTMKSIDYFEFGLPIINNIKGDTWDAVEKYEIGVNYNGENLPITTVPNNPERKNSRKYFEEYLTNEIFRKNVEKIIERLECNNRCAAGYDDNHY